MALLSVRGDARRKRSRLLVDVPCCDRRTTAASLQEGGSPVAVSLSTTSPLHTVVVSPSTPCGRVVAPLATVALSAMVSTRASVRDLVAALVVDLVRQAPAIAAGSALTSTGLTVPTVSREREIRE